MVVHRGPNAFVSSSLYIHWLSPTVKAVVLFSLVELIRVSERILSGFEHCIPPIPFASFPFPKVTKFESLLSKSLTRALR